MTRVLLALFVAIALFNSALLAEPLELNDGDSICIIGNTLPERMQHDGWLETLIHSRFPEKDLTIRNLAFSADTLTIRLRSAGFGEPDDFLTKFKADTVFAFFGYNESFAGEAGLNQFKTDLENFIKHTREQKYNGKSAPQLVLFSPIAQEEIGDPNLPDVKPINANIALYTKAMREVADKHNVPFIDLFDISKKAYENSDKPLTINGIHLTGEGNQQLAPAIDQALFGQRQQTSDWSQLEPLRQAVLDKNFHWFHRYRTTDGYSSYGGRSYLKFVDDQTNREVIMRELEVLDQMTANRDKRVWAFAQGKEFAVDDSNVPPFIEVITNKKGEGPNGEHILLDGEDAIGLMTVHENMEVNLFADEKQFSDLINPVQMATDLKGCIWVAVWPSYPHWRPDEEMNDKLLILGDTNGDGKADVSKVFADKLHNPTGFEFWGGGVLVAMAPDLLFLKDTDGDDVADVRVRVLHGLDSADTHHTANSFVLDPGGNLYFQEGVFHRTQTETPYGPERNYDACVWRYNPRLQSFDRYIAYGFANPHGHVFDRWGQGIVHDGTGANPYHDTLISGFMPFPQKHGRAPNVYDRRTRPCPGTEILSSKHFPDELQGNLLVGNVIGFQGILQYELKQDGSSLGADEVDPIVSSTDPNFRPSDFEIGGDGALYFTDWYNPLIGHMQHNLRDPSRDKKHGRVYRVTYKGRDLVENVPLDTLEIPELLEKLKSPEDRIRYRARIALSARPADQVVASIRTWIPRLDKSHPDYQHQLMEVLWVHQHHNVVNESLLEQMLASPEPRARAAAAKVLVDWRAHLPNALAQLRTLASDDDPRVRLEAVRGASFFTDPAAIEVAIITTDSPTDTFLDYTLGETMKVLEPQWKEAIARGEKVEFTSPAGKRYYLRNISTQELLTLERDEAVFSEMLFREGVGEADRTAAINGLAKVRNTTPLNILLETIQNIDKNARSQSVVFDLVRLLTGWNPDELKQNRNTLVEMATSAGYPVVRQIGYVALMAADDGIEPSWKLATSSVSSLRDFLSAMPLVLDPSFQSALYPRVKMLLHELPGELAKVDTGGGAFGRYVRIELPGDRRTLTLAEVEVFSNGQNIAPQGRATQINVGAGGVPERAIDGITSGLWGLNGQTHTQENIKNPWWELDLGEEPAIERIVIWNRTDGSLGERLKGFNLQLLDEGKNVVYEQLDQPAPKRKVQFKLEGGGPLGVVRRAAMNALVSVRGKEKETFDALTEFVSEGSDRLAAMRAIQRIPRRDWTVEKAPALVENTLAYLRSVPEADRRTPAAIESLQFGESLSGLLSAEDAARVRNELGQLGVQVVRLSTLPHRMSYDQERIVVQAGKSVEFIFENPDLMPHNFALVNPGKLEEIGLLAEANAQKPDFIANDYIPKSKEVLVSSRLLQPRDTQTFSFTAPRKPGIYPYVCTYPGHWRRMYGALYVVENRQEYLASPEDYLKEHPLETADALLEFARPRKEWTLAELTASLEDLENGRSFDSAKQIFTISNCVACHKLNNLGNEYGPDLAKLDPKWKTEEVIRHILEPSWKINEKFQTWIFVTDEGKVVTGMILEETPESIKLIENPLAKTPPITLQKSAIEDRKKSPTSLMPKGLLDRLRREEILDLLAYVISGGKKDHMYFHHHHHH